MPPAADGGPLLVLVHGTFVDTVSTFGKLWAQHPQRVRELFAHYGDRVYALDHPTLGVSPIANALTLVKRAAGRRARCTSSRTRAAAWSPRCWRASAAARRCGDDDLDAVRRRRVRASTAADLQRAGQGGAGQGPAGRARRARRLPGARHAARIEAARRLPLGAASGGSSWRACRSRPQLVDFLREVARRRADPTELPGLEAMMPDSPLVAVAERRRRARSPASCASSPATCEGDSIGSWLKTLLSDAFYWTDNDLVVQTRSMYGGAPRAEHGGGSGASFLLDHGGKVSHFNYFANERTARRDRRAR